MNDDLLARMTRTPDHETSVKAAAGVKRITIRAKVLAFAERMVDGFTDDQLRLTLGANAPESSYRKRRTELTDEGYIVKTDLERPNSNGEMAAVFVHRKFLTNPPLPKPKAKGSRAEAMQRRVRETKMFNALVAAAQYAHRLPLPDQEAIADALGIPFPIRVNDLPDRKAF